MMEGKGCPFGYGARASDEEKAPDTAATGEEVEPRKIGGKTLAPGEVYYADYLQLDKLLGAQRPLSVEKGAPAHDEMLFIIVHQVYELWFKQVLHELDLVISIFGQVPIPEKDIARINHHIERVIKIQKLLIEQIQIIETMSPLDFLEFRDLLYPASGFQSFQFRLVENRMGMIPERRLKFQCADYHTQLTAEHAQLVQKAEKEATLFSAVESWLERIPFLVDEEAGFRFWDVYKEAAIKMFDDEKERILAQTEDSKKAREEQLEDWENSKDSFFALLDENLHNEMRKKGQRRLTFKATQAALLITLYRDEPILAAPWGLLNHLIDLDNGMQHWRHRHSVMAHRMIGTKMGTGGSSGYYYLKATLQRGRVFDEISNLSTYLLPKRHLPVLPPSVVRKMNFHGADHHREY